MEDFIRQEGTRAGCMKCHLDDLSIEAVKMAFGGPDKESYYDPDSGYEMGEWGFVREGDGAFFCLYPRWGKFRVGSEHDDVDGFVRWVLDRVTTAEVMGL